MYVLLTVLEVSQKLSQNTVAMDVFGFFVVFFFFVFVVVVVV